MTTAPDSVYSLPVPTDVSTTFDYAIISVEDAHHCINTKFVDTNVFVTINPAPAKPIISAGWAPDTLTLCNPSSNINFNVRNANAALYYQWYSAQSGVDIRDVSHPNTVISFTNIGWDTIWCKAINGSNQCKDSDRYVVQIFDDANAIHTRKIILKQPGNLLVYPDNTMDAADTIINGSISTVYYGYQWGFDSIFHHPFDSLGSPQIIPGQVYQVFVPASKFLTPNGADLDTSLFAFWIQLKRDSCKSRVYYNGPYANKYISLPESLEQDVTVRLYPNPTQGDFNIDVAGNLYGNINIRLSDLMGQPVFKTQIVKKQAESIHPIHLPALPEGVYMLQLSGEDQQQYVIKLIIHP
jgi:hypothetical protein